MKRIYADNAATTAMDRDVLEAMLPYLEGSYGNPSSHYSFGREAKRAIEKARKDILSHLGAEGELYFTSGGTESNNWAISATAELMAQKGKRHIIASEIEHHSVLNCCKNLEKKGFQVTYVRPNIAGIVEPEAIARAVTPETGLVSIMYANNEIGTVQPIHEISDICRGSGIIFHSDAVQAVGHIEVDFKSVDLLSFSAHKFHGPKGIGGLYVRKGLNLPPLLHGGLQESGHRGGTENVAGIVGMAKAIDNDHKSDYIKTLRNKLTEGLLEIEGAYLNGDRNSLLPGIANIGFRNVDSEALMLMLDLQGICVSAGAACTTGSQEPSHVLKAIGLNDKEAGNSVRFSLGKYNTEEEIDLICQAVRNTVEKIRRM